jgi:hypothetical protein
MNRSLGEQRLASPWRLTDGGSEVPHMQPARAANRTDMQPKCTEHTCKSCKTSSSIMAGSSRQREVKHQCCISTAGATQNATQVLKHAGAWHAGSGKVLFGSLASKLLMPWPLPDAAVL